MKIKASPTLIAFSVFMVITGFFSTYEASSDGWTEIGFPFPFYIYTGGKIDPASINDIDLGFVLPYFLIDLVVLTLFIHAFNYVDAKYKVVKRV